MCAFIFVLLFAIIHSSLGGAHQSQYCREELGSFQDQVQSDSYLRRSYLDGEEIQTRLVPAIIPWSPDVNRNKNINVNSAHSLPVGRAAYSEWWEVIPERAPDGTKSAYLRVEPPSHLTSYDTIKTHINNDHGSRDSAEEPPRREVNGHSYQLAEPAEESHTDYRKHAPSPQGASRRSKFAPATEKEAQSKASKNHPNVLKNRKTPENPELQNELSRKSNENVNTNVNSNARRSTHKDDDGSRAEARKSANKNKNINLNDHSSNTIEEGLYELYQKIGKGSVDSDAPADQKSVGQSPHPIGDRSHSNLNHNVNANVNGDASLTASIIRPEDLRRHLINKKRLIPIPHHPNDNHNVNININGEEPAEEPEEEGPPGDQPAEPEAENPVTKKN